MPKNLAAYAEKIEEIKIVLRHNQPAFRYFPWRTPAQSCSQ
jgi:hypothetical protein